MQSDLCLAPDLFLERFLQSRDQRGQADDGVYETDQQDEDDNQYIDPREGPALRPFGCNLHVDAEHVSEKNID